MFCSNCGKEIDNKAVICVHCGVPTQNFTQQQQQQNQPQHSPAQPIIINNSSSSSAFSGGMGVRRHYSLLLDIILTLLTGGLWLIWVLLRPKYY